MRALLSIGEFSRMTHLSASALRHYDEVRLLPPADVDPLTGYRRYSMAQVARAQLVRRLRDLGMPLEAVRGVLEAPDTATRDALLREHLGRMERELDRTRAVVSSLRELLERPDAQPAVEYRTIAATPVLALRGQVDRLEITPWCADAFAELAHAVDVSAARPTGPGGAVFAESYFGASAGEVVAFVPVTAGPARPPGAVQAVTLPGEDCAIAVHHGPYGGLDRTYAALGRHVVAQGIGSDRPIREYYLVTPADSPDPDRLRTEVCWPVDR